MTDQRFKQELRQLALELKNGLPPEGECPTTYQTKLGGFCEACADKNGIRPETRRLVALRELGDFSHAVARIQKMASNGFAPEDREGLEDALDLVARLLDPARHLPPRSFWLSAENDGELDVLLPVASRKTFDADMKAAVAEASEAMPLSLLMLDLDHFKKINDTFGHRYGDEILKAVAAAVKKACHGKAKCYRYGGEELAVLAPNFAAGEARAFAERLRAAVAGIVIDEKGALCTVSVGVAECDGVRLGSYDALVNAADGALYQAKKEGRNLVRAHRPDRCEAETCLPRLGSNISLTLTDGRLKILYMVAKFSEKFSSPKKVANYLTYTLPSLQLHLDNLLRQANEDAEKKNGK